MGIHSDRITQNARLNVPLTKDELRETRGTMSMAVGQIVEGAKRAYQDRFDEPRGGRPR